MEFSWNVLGMCDKLKFPEKFGTCSFFLALFCFVLISFNSFWDGMVRQDISCLFDGTTHSSELAFLRLHVSVT